MRISDWSSDVCSSDLHRRELARGRRGDVARHAHGRAVDHRKRPEPRLRMAERREGRRRGIATRRSELGILGERLVTQSTEERRVGKHGVRTVNTRVSHFHSKKNYQPRYSHIKNY